MNDATPGTLLIRSDAGVSIGAGHVMRCLALAQAWQDIGGNAKFLMANTPPAIEEYLIQQGIDVIQILQVPGSLEDAEQLAEFARRHSAAWIVVDGSQFSEHYQAVIKEAGLRLLLVDDSGEGGRYVADMILNQNIGANSTMYANRESYTEILLGTQYVMLRREFRQWRNWSRNFPLRAGKILISLGGSDPEGLTQPVAEAIASVAESGVEILVVAGGANPKLAELQAAIERCSSGIGFLVNVRDMAKVMAESDLAIICGGGTLWETLFMGCTTLSYSRLGVQNEINQALRRSGLIVDLGLAEKFDGARLRKAVEDAIESHEMRRSMGIRGRGVVDGNGASRAVQALLLEAKRP